MTRIALALALAVAVSMTAGTASSFAAIDGITASKEAQTVDRRKPRVPGGSGCDSPRDLIQHPECRR